MSQIIVKHFPYRDYFQLIASIASLYNRTSIKAFRCLIESTLAMIPNDDLTKTGILLPIIKNNPLEDKHLKDRNSLLQWVYIITAQFYSTIINTPYMQYQEFANIYDPSMMTIVTWSHPSWNLIHYFPSKYDESKEYALYYKSFVSCLQYLLPCPKCRKHLRDNLADHPIDQYFGSRSDLFTWSYLLHQVVSAQTKKPGMTLTDAKRMYGVG